MQFPFEKLKDKYQNIPEDVQAAISSVEVADKLQAIGEKHKLHLDVAEKLFDVTGGVMLELIHPRDYIRTLAKELSVDTEQARAIAKDVNEEIFHPIRESLKSIHRIGGERGTDAKQNAEQTRKITTEEESPGQRSPIPPSQTRATGQAKVKGPADVNTLADKQMLAQEPPAPSKQGDVPAELPIETADDKAPEFEDEYPKHTTDEEIESREEILRGVEDAPLTEEPKNQELRIKNQESPETPESKTITPQPAKDITEKRLDGAFRAPSQKSEYDEEVIKEPEAPVKPETPDTTAGGYKRADPYREPIE